MTNMPDTFWGLVAAAVVVSVAHAALPSHWLAFVLVGRTRGWSGRRVMTVAAIAGLGHVTMTCLLGLLVAALGMELLEAVGAWGNPVTACVLFVTGGVYLVGACRGGHGHPVLHPHHDDHEHNHPHPPPHEGEGSGPAPVTTAVLSDRAAFWSLFSVLTFSPCEGMVPFFFASARFGWAGLIALAIVTGALTVTGMLVLVSLTQAGLEHLRLPVGERGERILTGVLLVALGAAAFVWH